MKASRWVSTFFPLVKSNDTVMTALHEMRKYMTDYCIVVDEDNKFDGIIHRNTIKEADLEDKIEDYVVFPDFYVLEDSTIEEAAMMLIENNEKILPVVNSNAEVVGVLSTQEVLEAMTEMSAMDEPGVRVNLVLPDKPGELKKVIDVLANNKLNILSILTIKNGDSRQVSIKLDSKDAESIANILELYDIKYETLVEEEGFF